MRRLLAWFDEGRDSEGRQYLEIRQRLVRYFERKNCVAADDLADETLNRVARRLEEAGAITDVPPAQYCYIVARFIFHEYLRRNDTEAGLNHKLNSAESSQMAAMEPGIPTADEIKQKLLDDLERCLERLEPQDRELILEYYQGEQREKIERRRALAERLGLTSNALTIRACRLRTQLEACVKAAGNK